MSTETPPLPQTGWVLDTAFAASLGVSQETLRDWIHEYRLPARQVGRTILIRAEEFYQALPNVEYKDGEEKKTKRTRT